MDHDLLPADKPVVTALTLGSLCLVTGAWSDPAAFDRRLRQAVIRGADLVQLRVPQAEVATLKTLGRHAAPVCREAAVPLVVNAAPDDWPELASDGSFDGLHLSARRAADCAGRPVDETALLGVSCHDADELDRAVALGADYAVVGSVAATTSHPGRAPLGFDGFATLIQGARLPIYAIGGMTPGDLPAAWAAGGQGIAAIGALWDGDEPRGSGTATDVGPGAEA